MKLFLAAEAKHPDSLAKLKEFVGGSFAGKTIAYIPTAANGEYYGSWKGGGSVRVVLGLGAQVNIVELEAYRYLNVLDQLKGADIIWLAGGVVGYLLYWLRRTELDKALPDFLAAGKIYVGSSASSMVCAPTNHAAALNIDEPEPDVDLYPGLGLVDFEIYPHFIENQKAQIEANWQPGWGKLYLLKNGDAITRVGDQISVLGEEIIIQK